MHDMAKAATFSMVKTHAAHMWPRDDQTLLPGDLNNSIALTMKPEAGLSCAMLAANALLSS